MCVVRYTYIDGWNHKPETENKQKLPSCRLANSYTYWIRSIRLLTWSSVHECHKEFAMLCRLLDVILDCNVWNRNGDYYPAATLLTLMSHECNLWLTLSLLLKGCGNKFGANWYIHSSMLGSLQHRVTMSKGRNSQQKRNELLNFLVMCILEYSE